MNIVKEESGLLQTKNEARSSLLGKCIRMREVQDDDNTGMQSACDDVDDDIKLFLGWFHCA